MMFASSLHLLLLLLLTITCLTAQAANPDCAHVADFDNCVGDTNDFCPKGIACGCKDKVPYCKCPSFRNKWDYWYMGPKCNYLWSTLDLILMIAVPAVTLSTVVFTLMQWNAYCRSQPKKSRSQDRQPGLPAPVIPNNPQRQLEAQPKQMLAFPRPLAQNQEEIPFPDRSSYSPQRPLPRAVQYAQVGRSNHWVNEMPSADYDQETPFEELPMRPFPKPKVSFPLRDYGENSSQPMNHLIANTPSRFVHPQYTYN